MRVEKAIIPVAGWGTRRLPITKTLDKNMLPVGNRPVIDYVIEDCVRAGIKDIYLVVNSIDKSQIKEYYGENLVLEEFLRERGADEKLAKLKTVPDGVNLHWVEQDVNRSYGTAVPVALVVKEFGLDEPVMFCNGDDFFWNVPSGSAVKDAVENFDGEALITGVVRKPEEMVRYGMLEKDKTGHLVRLVEKPDISEVTSDLANVNRFVLTPELLKGIVEYVDGHNFGPDDQEYMITDPIFDFICGGGKMKAIAAQGEWMDCGSVEGWLHANRVVLGDK